MRIVREQSAVLNQKLFGMFDLDWQRGKSLVQQSVFGMRMVKP
jgi:hypothetical protein